MIYAVQILDSKYVKIGYSLYDTSRARVAALQTGCPFEIQELLCINGTLRQEQTLHAMLNVAFGRIRIPIPPNEWYPGKNPFFQQFLKELSFGFDAGLGHLAKYQPSVKQPGQKGSNVDPTYRWPI